MKHERLKVLLTADIEFDVNGSLTFPLSHSPAGAESVFRLSEGGAEHGLAPLLAPLRQYDLPATFFIETLQCHHFGLEPMGRVIERLVEHSKIDLQLHVHPCWRYFRDSNWRDSVQKIRRNDSMAGRGAECGEILSEAQAFFGQLTGSKPLALRTGSLSIDHAVYEAQAKLGIPLASSIGIALAPSPAPDLHAYSGLVRVDGVVEIPVTSFDALGLRGTQKKLLTVTGNALSQIVRVLEWHWRHASGPVVVLTHPSEMAPTYELKTPPEFTPAPLIQKRWGRLCQYLSENEDKFEVTSMQQSWGQFKTMPELRHSPYNGGPLPMLSQLLSRIGMTA